MYVLPQIWLFLSGWRVYCSQIREHKGLRWYVERQCVWDLHVDWRTAGNLRRSEMYFRLHHTGSMECHICVSGINHCSKHYSLFWNGYERSGNAFFRSYIIIERLKEITDSLLLHSNSKLFHSLTVEVCLCMFVLVEFLFWIAVWPILGKETVVLTFCLQCSHCGAVTSSASSFPLMSWNGWC